MKIVTGEMIAELRAEAGRSPRKALLRPSAYRWRIKWQRTYEAWCADNKLPLMPADQLSCELDYARDVTYDACKIDRITHQLQLLATFIKRWEKVTGGPGA